MDEDMKTTVDRMYIKLHYMLSAQMPRPGLHRYSTGAMYSNFVTRRLQNGWQMEMSQGITYSQYAMGYKDDGSRRTPRGELERINFRTIDHCIKEIMNMKKEGSL